MILLINRYGQNAEYPSRVSKVMELLRLLYVCMYMLSLEFAPITQPRREMAVDGDVPQKKRKDFLLSRADRFTILL